MEGEDDFSSLVLGYKRDSLFKPKRKNLFRGKPEKKKQKRQKKEKA